MSGKYKKSITIVVLFFSAFIFLNGQIKYGNTLTLNNQGISIASQSVVDIHIDYRIPSIRFDSIKIGRKRFCRVSLPDHIPSAIEGEPEIPVYTRLIFIPEGYSCAIEVSDISYKTFYLHGNNINDLLYPVQKSTAKNLQQTKTEYLINEKTYSSRQFIRHDSVTIEPLGYARGNKIALLSISPLSYNPSDNIISLISSMKIHITFHNDPHVVKAPVRSFNSYRYNRAALSETLNFPKKGNHAGMNNNHTKMIILTDTTFINRLQPLIKWKRQKGIEIIPLYWGAKHAGTSSKEVRNTIKTIYDSYIPDETPPEYLMIVGNTSIIPYYTDSEQVTDLYYGEMDGDNDYIPELFTGRIPVADTTELGYVCDKIIQYEKYEFADTNNFNSRALMMAGLDDSYRNYMNGQIYYGITNYLTAENGIDEKHFYYPNTIKDSVVKLINNGLAFVNYTGHGNATSWEGIKLDIADVNAFTNNNMYPFIISNACKTSLFSSESLGNKMVVNDKKGAIGFIGCSNDSFWNEDFYWSVGTIHSINAEPTYEETGLGALDKLFHTHEEDIANQSRSLGEINYGGNMSVSSSTSSRKQYYWETYNVVGDPSLMPIIGSQSPFNIHLPDTLPTHINSLTISSAPFSYIAISNFDTLWDAAHAGYSGTLTINIPETDKDSCLIVATGQNKIPLIKTIYFSEIDDEFINLSSSYISDIEGNNNGKADYGETIFLNLLISNFGNTDASNLSVDLSSSSEWISVLNNSTHIDTIKSNSETAIKHLLSFKVKDSIPDLEIVTLTVSLKDDATEKTYNIDIGLHSPDIKITSSYIDDSVSGNGNMYAEAGESFDMVFIVENTGSSTISGKLNVSTPDENIITFSSPTTETYVFKHSSTSEVRVKASINDNAQNGDFFDITSRLLCNKYTDRRTLTFRVGRRRESFEAASLKIFPWINIDDEPWFITESFSHDGISAARSGFIKHKQSSTLKIRTYYPEDDTISFYYNVSSENPYDYFLFNINKTNHIKVSGETAWEKASVPVATGYNTMEWIYRKDLSISSGRDNAIIDMIDFSQNTDVRFIDTDLSVDSIISPAPEKYPFFEDVKVAVSNHGADTIKSFNLAYSVNDKPAVVEHFTAELEPFGKSVEVCFSENIDLSEFGNYNIKVYATGNDDDYPLNDSLHLFIENKNIATVIDSNEYVVLIKVFPNPFLSAFTISLNARKEGLAHLCLHNMLGMKVSEFYEYVSTGPNELVIEDKRLAPSIYYLTIDLFGLRKTLPIIKAAGH